MFGFSAAFAPAWPVEAVSAWGEFRTIPARVSGMFVPVRTMGGYAGLGKCPPTTPPTTYTKNKGGSPCY